MFRKAPLPWNSIRFKLILSFLIVTVPLVALLLYNNFYAIHVVREQVALSNKNMMSLYMGQIDSGLKDVDKYLVSLVSSEINLQIMAAPQSIDDYMMAKFSLNRRLTDDLLMYKVDSLFVYSESRNDLLDVYKMDSNLEFVRSFIRNQFRQKQQLGQPPYSNWSVYQINRDYYLFRLQKLGDITVGAWLKKNTLMMPLNLVHLGENGAALFVTDLGVPLNSPGFVSNDKIDLGRSLEKYYMTGGRNKYLVVGEPSQEGNFRLVALLRLKHLRIYPGLMFRRLLFRPLSKIRLSMR